MYELEGVVDAQDTTIEKLRDAVRSLAVLAEWKHFSGTYEDDAVLCGCGAPKEHSGGEEDHSAQVAAILKGVGL